MEKQEIGLMLCEKAELNRVKNTNRIFEEKLDGIRAVSVNGKIYNRKEDHLNRNITSKFPEIETPKEFILDGEIISTKGDLGDVVGRSTLEDDFRIELRSKDNPAKFVIFDILSVSNKDLQELPLLKRKKTLSNQDFSNYNNLEKINYYEKAETVWNYVLENGLEGLIAKNPNSKYVKGRNENWLKIKNWEEKVFDIEKYERTKEGGFVIKVPLDHNEDLQKVVVNSRKDQKRIKKNFEKGLKAEIQFLEYSKNNRLRKPSFKSLKDNY